MSPAAREDVAKTLDAAEAALLRGERPEAFVWCDHVTSGALIGACTARDAARDKALRDARFAGLVARMSPAQQQAWPALEAAWMQWANAHATHEVDQSGTLRAALTVSAIERDLDALERWSRGVLDRRAVFLVQRDDALTTSDAAPPDLQRKLADALARLATPDGWFDDAGEYGTPGPEGHARTQQAWHAARDTALRWAALSVSPQDLTQHALALDAVRFVQLQDALLPAGWPDGLFADDGVLADDADP